MIKKVNTMAEEAREQETRFSDQIRDCRITATDSRTSGKCAERRASRDTLVARSWDQGIGGRSTACVGTTLAPIIQNNNVRKENAEGGVCQSGLPQEPCRQRSHARYARRPGVLDYSAQRGCRHHRRQHVRVYRQRQEGIDRYDSRDGGTENAGQLQEARGCRLPGGTLPRGNPEGNSGDRFHLWSRRAGTGARGRAIGLVSRRAGRVD